jgi:uncharacterized protein YqgV (UPF0045/DUF77 family)
MASEMISVEVSLYPLRELDLGPAILDFVEALRAEGLQVEPGPMSSLLVGEADQVFDALKRAFVQAGRRHQVILRAVFATAAPPRGQPGRQSPGS